MARGGRKESLPKSIPFESFSLEQLFLTEVSPGKRTSTDPRVTETEGETVCAFKNQKTGRTVDGTVTIRSHATKDYIEKSLTFEKFRVALSTKGTEIYLGLDIYDRHDSILVTSDIARQEKQGKQKLPPGTGIMLYEKALDYIASRARTKPLTHTVQMGEVNTVDTSLTRAQWQKTFPPVLSKRGYEKISDGVWEKKYEPGSSKG